MKRRLLFAYPSMMLGGSTTSLISLLYALDPAKYDIDLQLLEADGALQGEIPPWINVLPQARASAGGSFARLKSPGYVVNMAKMLWNMRVSHNEAAASQLRSLAGFRFDRRQEKKYDLAISFLETWPTYYVAKYADAPKKVTWLHLNYAGSGMKYALDRPYLRAFDKIVLVAESVRADFARMAPELAERTVYIPNLLSEKKVRAAAAREISDFPFEPEGALKLVTVCRMAPVKALDRAARAVARLKAEGLAGGLKWLIIGDGECRAALEARIAREGLSDIIYTIGARVNPMPYVARCDAFFLPSLSEGKPMSVTEAQMLGLPALVTEYPAAREQITEGEDGLIFENSEEGLCAGLRRALSERPLIDAMRAAAARKSYENPSDLAAVERLFDALR